MLDGRSWTVAEVPQDDSLSHHECVGGPRHNTGTVVVDRPDPPSVVTQHLQINRQFVIINSKVLNVSVFLSVY